jgi:hypothetical protein
MITTARRALFTVLILLTAFRGMVGDAMAYGMTGQMMNAQVAINSVAFGADSMPGNARFDSKIMDLMPCHESSAEQAMDINTPSSESVCSTCQVCHLSVTLPLPVFTCSPTLPQSNKPSLRAGSWVSAELRLLSKPPLS